MTEKIKQGLENITVSFRFIIPILMAAYFYAYSSDQNKLHSDISEIKDGQVRAWTAIKTVDTKIDAVRDKEALDFTYVLEHYVKPQG